MIQMLSCPVCRSQNMDTAKFCGNCGNPFPRPSLPTSSLINCPQGHVYSAVYQYCPYCPQPESASVSDTSAAFATRVEEPATAFEPPNSFPSVSPSVSAASNSFSAEDFQTNAEPFATNFETRVNSFEGFETKVNTPEMFETKIGDIDVAEVINQAGSHSMPTQASAPTEMISHLAETTIAEMPAITIESKPADTDAQSFQAPPITQVATVVSDLPPFTPYVAPPTPPPIAHPQAQPVDREEERRTILVADESSLQRSTKGRLVGWLVSYTTNPDGEDFRIYSGYNRIGANPVCDIVIDDETVSGSHAIIVHREGRFLIKDDLSRNGTFVNGREISEAHPLQSYDAVRLGNTTLTFIAAQRTS